jgi:hypothetical protein
MCECLCVSLCVRLQACPLEFSCSTPFCVSCRQVRRLFEKAVSYAKLRFLSAPPGSMPTILMEDVIGKEPSRATNPELDAALAVSCRL